MLQQNKVNVFRKSWLNVLEKVISLDLQILYVGPRGALSTWLAFCLKLFEKLPIDLFMGNSIHQNKILLQLKI